MPILGIGIDIWLLTPGTGGRQPIPPSLELLDAQNNELLDAQGANLESAS